MKSYFLSIAIFLLGSTSIAQTNNFPPNGNVTIGTQEPVEVLTIGEYGGSIALRDRTTALSGTSSLGRLKFYDFHGDAASIGLEHNYYFGGTPRAMLFSVNGAERLRIISNGNVGIGTTNPGSPLTIKGSGTGISFSPVGSPYFGTLAFNREAQTGDIFDPTGFAFQINNGGTDTNLHFQIYGGGGNLITNNALVIESNGNIGIGTSDTKGYKLAVAGNMIAESIKVKLQNVWPDYIFTKSYQLPSLQDTEKHIKEKGHLPDIPSAEEVKANGIDLGEMNAKLLQKIEELTLYLIEMKKEMKALQTKVDNNEKTITFKNRNYSGCLTE